MGKAGILERHLESIYQAVLDYLEYKAITALGELDKINYLVNRELEGKGAEPPEMPEAYSNLNKFNLFKILPYTGGEMNQPLVYMREMIVANNAEIEYKAIQRRNRELAELRRARSQRR